MQDSRTNAAPGNFLTALLLALILGGGVTYLLWHRQQALTERQEAQRRAVQAKLREMAQAHAAASQTRREEPPYDRHRYDALAGRLEEWDASLQETDPQSRVTIRNLLLEQRKAWNKGDIDLFMEYYWKSDDLTFSSGGKVTRGWQATLDRYKKRYSTREEMGTLAFDNLEISPISGDAALVLGEWKLTREGDDLGGNFSLVFRRIDGRWVIVHDHTSKAD